MWGGGGPSISVTPTSAEKKVDLLCTQEFPLLSVVFFLYMNYGDLQFGSTALATHPKGPVICFSQFSSSPPSWGFGRRGVGSWGRGGCFAVGVGEQCCGRTGGQDQDYEQRGYELV